MSSQKPYPGTQSLLRAIAILKTFSTTKPEWGLSELAGATNLNKTTAFRLLSALESEGIVERNQSSGLYRLGPDAIVLGGRALRANDLWSASQIELKRLAAETGETATLEVLSGTKVMILDEELGTHVVGTMPSIGTRWPLHATSTGKLFLAHMTPEERAALLTFPLHRLTTNTIINQETMDQELEKIWLCGYAGAIDELEIGYTGLGAPVYDHVGNMAGTISLGGPTSRLAGKQIHKLVSLLLAGAKRISTRLGYSPCDSDDHLTAKNLDE